MNAMNIRTIFWKMLVSMEMSGFLELFELLHFFIPTYQVLNHVNSGRIAVFLKAQKNGNDPILFNQISLRRSCRLC